MGIDPKGENVEKLTQSIEILNETIKYTGPSAQAVVQTATKKELLKLLKSISERISDESFFSIYY